MTLPSTPDGTEETGPSCYLAITLYKASSNISARPSGKSWKEVRKAESESPVVPASLQRPIGQPLRTLQKCHYVFGNNPNVGIRTTLHPVVLAILSGYYTPANDHYFVDLRGVAWEALEGLYY